MQNFQNTVHEKPRHSDFRVPQKAERKNGKVDHERLRKLRGDMS